MFPILLLITVFTRFCQSAIIEYQRDPSRCETGWVPNWDDQRCIHYFQSTVERLAAVGFCEAFEDRLVSVDDADKLNFIIRNGPSQLQFWIDNKYDEQTWTPAQVLDESFYSTGPQCVAMEMLLLGLKMVNCNIKLSTICEKPLGSDSYCATNWTLFRDDREEVCLGFFPGPTERTHSESSRFCGQQGGRLAIPRTYDKYKALLLGREEHYLDSYWLGMHFSQSEPGNPLLFDDGSRVPDCVLVTTGPQGSTGRADCFSEHNAVCEKYMSPPQSDNDCTDGWLKYRETRLAVRRTRCIRYYNDVMSNFRAKFTCRLHNARLVIIWTASKRDFVAQNRPYQGMEYWITDRRYDEMAWSPLHGLIGDVDDPCVKMNGTSRILSRVPCGNTLSYVCEKVTGPGHTCAQDWTLYHTSDEHVCLKAFPSAHSYKRAAADCRRKGGYVAMPTSADKITAIIRAQPRTHMSMYVGMYRTSFSLRMTYDNGVEIESCRWMNPGIATTSGFKSCGLKKRFICEKLHGTP